ncbi:MAG: hypothetical protein PHP92_03895 [Candidatus Nanoarchaeia archaeon]|nr:hypothetical protein [Candidatus Nanoarchaeia archaeon]
MEVPGKIKSFWEKPEGTTGMVFAVGGGGILIYLLYKFLPFIIILMQNTLHAVLLMGALAVILYVIFDKRARTLVWYMYKMIMKKITGLFINLDPIAIIETYVESLQDNLEKMDGQIGNLKGQMSKLKRVIEENNANVKSDLEIANKAKQTGKNNIMILKTRQVGRLQESNTTLSNLLTRMELLYRVLSKMYENAGVLLEDIRSEVDVKKRERDAIKAGYSALRSAMSIINGDPDKKEMFESAMQNIADDVGKKVGEMERFMEVSKSFMDSIDIQNEIFDDKGMKMLEQWEQEGDSLLLGSDKNVIISETTVQEKVPIKVKTNKYRETLK